MHPHTSRGSGILGGNSAAYWAIRRNRVKLSIYPDGPLTTQPDSVATCGFTLPTGVGHGQRLTIASSGGRDVRGSSSHVDVWYPDVAPVGKCFVMMTGHLAGALPWYDSTAYCTTDGSSMILRLLADGWHVLVADMPAYGTMPYPEVVYSAGSPLSYTQHNCWALFSDGGPSPNRLFLDQIIRGMNWVTATLGITKFGLMGHSGGAQTSAMMAAIDDRFSCFFMLGGGPFQGAGTIDDVEAYYLNPTIQASGSWVSAMAMVGAAVFGRHTVYSYSAGDEFRPLDFPLWQAEAVTVNSYLAGNGFATVEFFNKINPHIATPADPCPYHDPDPTLAEFVEATMLTHV